MRLGDVLDDRQPQAGARTGTRPLDTVEPLEYPREVLGGYAGTGLGLPLSKHLVELHGGRMEIESRVGQGTTVRVTLPPERVMR